MAGPPTHGSTTNAWQHHQRMARGENLCNTGEWPRNMAAHPDTHLATPNSIDVYRELLKQFRAYIILLNKCLRFEYI